MKYNQFLKDGSFRSNYFWEEWNKNTLTFGDILSMHKSRASSLKQFIELTDDVNEVNKLKKEIAFLEDQIKQIETPPKTQSLTSEKKNNEISKRPTKNEIDFFDFSMYIRKQYLDLTDQEKEILIYKSKESISEFLWLMYEIIFEREYEEVDYGLVIISEDDKERYMKLRNQSEIIDFFKAVRLGLMWIDTENLELLDEDMKSYSNKQYLRYFGDKTLEEFKDFIKFHSQQYEIVLRDVLYPQSKISDYDNYLLKELKSIDHNLYGILQIAIQKNIISIESDMINFPYSQTTIATIFKVNKFTKWKIISKNILSHGDILTKSFGKTCEDTETAEYKQFTSKLKN